MIQPSIVRQLIRISLQPLTASRYPLYSQDAEEILMMIAAHESGLGEDLEQIGGGPALGLCQIERETLVDNYHNFLNSRKELRKQVVGVAGCDGIDFDHLQYNHLYNIIHARLKLYRAPGKLPSWNDQPAMAEYAKLYFNSPDGAATAQKYLDDYKRLVL